MNTQICVKYEGRDSECTVKPIYQYDVGRQLCISNIDQNAIIQIHYSISGMAKALTDIPTYDKTNEVWKSNIPNALLAQQSKIQIYVYVTTNTSSQTVMYISIPITPRPKPEGLQYTETDLKGLDYVLSQLAKAQTEVEALKEDVEDTIEESKNATFNVPYIDQQTTCWMVWDALTGQYNNTGVLARGENGESGVYIGETEPTDESVKVWINPNGAADVDVDKLSAAFYALGLSVQNGAICITYEEV